MVELMRGLHETGFGSWTAFAGRHDNVHLSTARASSPWYSRHVRESTGSSAGRSPFKVLQQELEFRKLASGAHLVHRTYHPVVDMLPRHAVVVETLHDMWDFVGPVEPGSRAVMRRHFKKRSLERADWIICVSQSTRDYLDDVWPRLADRSIVIPHGTTQLSDQPFPVTRNRPFFLFVGRRDRYKNFKTALGAMALLPADYELLCFGGGPLTREESEGISQSGLGGRVHQVNGDDHLLAGLYRAAQALIYPSRHEGFGLPLLEAMALGCPVIAAPLTSLPEVGGEAALYADPDDLWAWKRLMNDMSTNDTARANLIRAGKTRAAAFSWSKTAERHAKLYQELGCDAR